MPLIQDQGNVDTLKTVAYEANSVQRNYTLQLAIINTNNENCKATVIYNISMALNEVESGLMVCSRTGTFSEIKHFWIVEALEKSSQTN